MAACRSITAACHSLRLPFESTSSHNSSNSESCYLTVSRSLQVQLKKLKLIQWKCNAFKLKFPLLTSSLNHRHGRLGTQRHIRPTVSASEQQTVPVEANQLDSENHRKEAWKALCSVRSASPLVHCVTNFVAMDLSANVLLAAGASPAMVHGIEEVEEFASIASVLSINIGTLTGDWVQSMHKAASQAKAFGKPWVLDPVAAGATQFRTRTCLELVDLQPTVIRGNASEILALSGATLSVVKGVDSTHESTDALVAAKELSKSAGCIVAVSGATDIVTDGERVLLVSNGVPLLQKITATGCSVTALIAAFLAVLPRKPLFATAYALCLFGVAAEIAYEHGGSDGPGALRVKLIDALHGLTEEQVLSLAKISEM